MCCPHNLGRFTFPIRGVSLQILKRPYFRMKLKKILITLTEIQSLGYIYNLLDLTTVLLNASLIGFRLF